MDAIANAGQLTGAQREELIGQVKQQLAVANAQELLTVKQMLSKKLVYLSLISGIHSLENVGKMFQEVCLQT